MKVVKLRPEHVPHILNIATVKKELRENFVRSNYSGHSRDVLLSSLDLLDEHNIFEMVPGADDICRLCKSPYQCKSNSMDLIDERPIREFFSTEEYLARSIAYVSHAGKKYTLDELRDIDRKFEEDVLRNLSR